MARSTLLNIEDMESEYRFAKGTLYNWRHAGDGPPSVRLGRRVMYRRADVEAWIAELERKESAGRSS